jgi:phage-related protein
MTEELKVVITAEINKLKSELDKGKKEVEDFGKKGKMSFQEFNEGFQQVGDAAKKGLAVAGAAVAGAATALLALGGATKEYRVAQSKLTTAFEAAGSSAGVAKDVYNDLYRTLGDTDRAVEAANHLAKLTTSEKELSEWTNICQGIYATFGDSLPIEGLTEAANETARVGAVTGPLADALNWAGVSEDAFNEKLLKCANTQEREALIRETLNGLYEDAAAGYEENAAEILAANEAQEKLNAKMAELGEAMTPINTMLATFATEILAQITPFLVEFAEKHGPTIKQVLSDVATAIGEVIGFIVDNWDTISLIATIVGSIAIAIATVSTALSVYNTIMTIVNSTMWASPITWIVAAIVALIAAIILCIVYWDEIKEAMLKVWEWIKEAWGDLADWFKEKVIDPIVKFFSGLWDGIKAIFNVVKDYFVGRFTAAVEGIKTAFSAIKNFFTGLWDGIKAVFSAVGTFFADKFKQAVTNIKNTFSTIKSFFSGVWQSIKDIFSKVGSAIGGAITNTVKSAINGVLSSAIKIINGFISAINLAISVINKIPGVNIKKLSKLSVPKLAKGGIIDSATLAVVGEQGKEAVVPLENNLEWLDKLADRLASKTGGSTPVVLNVDGKTFAQTSISTINELTRQTGSLKLNIM